MSKHIGIIMVLALAVTSVLSVSSATADDGRPVLNSLRPYRSTSDELLRSAACYGRLDEIRSLLKRGARLEVADDLGWTPLIWAQVGNRPEAVALLLELGANVNARDASGYTALMRASMAGQTEIAEILVDRGADVTLVNKRGWTPLMEAAYYGRAETVEVLLAAGANPNAVTRDGSSALSLAKHASHPHVAMLLMANGADPDLQVKRFQAAAAASSRGPVRVRFAGQFRNPEIMETVCVNCQDRRKSSGVVITTAMDEQTSRFIETLCKFQATGKLGDAGARKGSGAIAGLNGGNADVTAVLSEALQNWDRVRTRYPDADRRIREYVAGHGASAAIGHTEMAPMISKAMTVWATINREHPELASQLLSLMGIGR